MGEMINANELRIGNYVSDNFASDSFFAQVKKLDFTRCHYGNFHSCYSDLKPIPITEEWLLKFGFEQRDHLWSIDIDRYNKINYNSDQKLLFSGQLGFSIQHDIKYIHQLQNLYFALTQKELTLND